MTILSKLNDSSEFLCEFLCRLKEYLGSGQFGIVYHGLLTVTGADSEDEVKEVAVKTTENGASHAWGGEGQVSTLLITILSGPCMQWPA